MLLKTGDNILPRLRPRGRPSPVKAKRSRPANRCSNPLQPPSQPALPRQGPLPVQCQAVAPRQPLLNDTPLNSLRPLSQLRLILLILTDLHGGLPPTPAHVETAYARPLSLGSYCLSSRPPWWAPTHAGTLRNSLRPRAQLMLILLILPTSMVGPYPRRHTSKQLTPARCP